MSPIDVKELLSHDHHLRARHLCKLKRSLERHEYHVDPEQIARDMMLEVWSSEALHRFMD